MNFRVLFIYLQLCLFLQNGYSQESSLVVPVISLCPEEAITLRTSELFDGYRIFSLNGCSYDRMLDILEVGDQFIALLEMKSVILRCLIDMVISCNGSGIMWILIRELALMGFSWNRMGH